MRILAIALCLLLASCGVVNQQAVMPEERHSGASSEEAVITAELLLSIIEARSKQCRIPKEN